MELTAEKIAELKKLPTGNVGDANGKKGCLDSGIKPIDPKTKMIGRAVTVECFPGDNLALHQGIYAAKAGDVLVFDCHGYSEAGHFGDIMATACQLRGIAGVVINGSCRDSQDILESGFPVFVRAYHPGGTVKEGLAKINVPLVIGNVQICPGDILFGDCDGIVVVKKEEEDSVFEKAEAIYEKEIHVKEQLKAGMTTLEIYHFDERIQRKKELEL